MPLFQIANAPQFKLVCTVVDREWRTILKDKEVINYISTEEIKWKNTPLPLHLGRGFL